MNKRWVVSTLYRCAKETKNRDHWFCSASLALVDTHYTLESAWRACDRPSWMIWWLHDWLRVDRKVETAVARYAGVEDITYSSDDINPRACEKIREAITYWGEPLIDLSPFTSEED